MARVQFFSNKVLRSHTDWFFLSLFFFAGSFSVKKYLSKVDFELLKYFFFCKRLSPPLASKKSIYYQSSNYDTSIMLILFYALVV